MKCAIYTRKSSDEGLDKEFNTLEAQREACENYIKSQVHQGWKIIPTTYDDGGFSGGNMNRPAFQALMKDIQAGKVDMIVVYKIDRLTRSLTDFSKMIEVLDAHNCSFVSVTQSFNTADSMGRLMLNVLLSFAQFEREVSGERIRDKIKASRAKGMWTGGVVPYGYKIENKKLLVDDSTSPAVKMMFDNFLLHKSSLAVANMLSDYGYKTFRRDAIQRMLQNPIYIGKTRHKSEIHDGQHDPIIDVETFNQVQEIIKTKDISKRSCVFKKNEIGILRSLLTCGCCNTSMTPANCQTRGIRRYYYTSTRAKYYGHRHCHNGAIPVPVLDECILKMVAPMFMDAKILHIIIQKIAPDKTGELFKIMQTPEKIFAKMSELEKSLMMRLLIKNITIHYDTMEITWNDVALWLLPDCLSSRTAENIMTIELPFIRRKGALEINLPEEFDTTHSYNQELIVAISKAFNYQKRINSEHITIRDLALELEIDDGYLGRLLRLNYLAPDIIKSILAGTQPKGLLLQQLIRNEVPAIWEDQRKLYNFKKGETHEK